MNVKGKQIKDYILGDCIRSQGDMQLLDATQRGKPVTILMVESKNVEQQSFVAYNNLLLQNSRHIHPKYIEPIRSTNNIYVVLQKISKVEAADINYLELLPSMVQLYRNMGQLKLQQNGIFVTAKRQLVFLPFYKRLQTSSKFYAQFHNKSVLGQVFCKIVPVQNKNKLLDIFVKNIDSPSAVELISKAVVQQACRQQDINDYPSMQEQADDQQIMQLMSKVKVNADMKKQAGQFLRLSKRSEQNQPQISNIMQNVESSMLVIKDVKVSTTKTKMGEKLVQSKVPWNQFELYFNSYCQSLRFLKTCVKYFLSHYKNSFAGIISAYLLSIVITLRKAYLIKQLQSGNDVFELDINMQDIPIGKCTRVIKRELRSQAKMIAQLNQIVDGWVMPAKTYSILAPYLEADISKIDFSKLQTFTFFFLSALLKSREKQMHQLYMVEAMYILLHRNYQIVFFLNDFPSNWNQQYFDTKVALIESLLPSWCLK